jgi:hypothetical protein
LAAVRGRQAAIGPASTQPKAKRDDVGSAVSTARARASNSRGGFSTKVSGRLGKASGDVFGLL